MAAAVEGPDDQARELAERVAAARARAAELADTFAVSRSGYDAAMERATTLGEQLAVAKRHVANLEKALSTSRCIGMAVGIVMERRGVTSSAAWDLLRQISQRRNRKLRDVAEHIVFTGDIPAA